MLPRLFLLLALLLPGDPPSPSRLPAALVQADVNPAQGLPERGVRVTYLGTNGYLLEARGATLLVDPFFSRPPMLRVGLNLRVDRYPERVEEALARLPRKVDAVLVTHGHIDHLMDAPAVLRATGARLVASPTSVALVRAHGIPAARCRPVLPGAVHRAGTATVRVLPADHDRVLGHRLYPGTLSIPPPRAPTAAADWLCGEPLAFLVEIGGRRIYLDSGGTRRVPAPAGPVDLAICGVALADSRARLPGALAVLHPRWFLPSHQDDFFRPLSEGFHWGLLTDFPQVRAEAARAKIPLVLLDYFAPWTL